MLRLPDLTIFAVGAAASSCRFFFADRVGDARLTADPDGCTPTFGPVLILTLFLQILRRIARFRGVPTLGKLLIERKTLIPERLGRGVYIFRSRAGEFSRNPLS